MVKRDIYGKENIYGKKTRKKKEQEYIYTKKKGNNTE